MSDRHSHKCRVYWGSHGCRKNFPHLGKHLCEPGCGQPGDDTSLYGEDVLAENAAEDQRLREEMSQAHAKRDELPMSLERDCVACQFGLHDQHNADEGLIPGLIGGYYCACTGDCAERARDRAQRVLDRLKEATEIATEPFIREDKREAIVLHMDPDLADVPEPAIPYITCPVCKRTSYNPTDVAEGYCGFCHDFTGVTTFKGQPISHRLPVIDLADAEYGLSAEELRRGWFTRWCDRMERRTRRIVWGVGESRPIYDDGQQPGLTVSVYPSWATRIKRSVRKALRRAEGTRGPWS